MRAAGADSGGGGGGGLYAFGGKGGFGGGQGGAGFVPVGNTFVPGYAGGGGGLGAGGAVFVEQGGKLTVTGGGLGQSGISGSSVAGGAGGVNAFTGESNAQAGSAFGSGVFLEGDETLTLDPAANQTLVYGNVADENGSEAGYGSDKGGLLIDGAGTVELGGNNTYTGVTTVEEGALEKFPRPTSMRERRSFSTPGRASTSKAAPKSRAISISPTFPSAGPSV